MPQTPSYNLTVRVTKIEKEEIERLKRDYNINQHDIVREGIKVSKSMGKMAKMSATTY